MSSPTRWEAEHAVLARLDLLGLPYTLHHHDPVYTVDAARAVRSDPVLAAAVHTKNLFLRDKKETMWLLTVREDAPVDLKALRDVLGSKGNPSFGSAERLLTYLGVEAGSVTPLAAMNDAGGAVRVLLDEGLRAADRVACHPNHNAATVTLAVPDLVRFLEASGHPPAWIALPG